MNFGGILREDGEVDAYIFGRVIKEGKLLLAWGRLWEVKTEVYKCGRTSHSKVQFNLPWYTRVKYGFVIINEYNANCGNGFPKSRERWETGLKMWIWTMCKREKGMGEVKYAVMKSFKHKERMNAKGDWQRIYERWGGVDGLQERGGRTKWGNMYLTEV